MSSCSCLVFISTFQCTSLVLSPWVKHNTTSYSSQSHLIAFHHSAHSHYVILISVLPCPTLPYTIVPYTTPPCPTLSYPALHYRTLSYPALHYPVVPHPALHYPTLPYPALHYPALHYPILHYPALHYPALPYSTLSYPTLNQQFITSCPASLSIFIPSFQWIIRGSSVNWTGSDGYWDL